MTAKFCCALQQLSLVSSAAEARYWRHYGYHWYGRSWNGSRPNSDERQVEKQPLGTEPGNDPRQVGDFGAAIEQMIHACDRQVAELKDMPLDAVAEMVNPTRTNARHWIISGVWHLTLPNRSRPHVQKTLQLAFTSV